MPLKFRCVCGQALIVSRKFVGRAVRCPQCDTKLRVPEPKKVSEVKTPAEPPPVSRSQKVDEPVSRQVPPPVPPQLSAGVRRASAQERAAAPPIDLPSAADEVSDDEASLPAVRGYEPTPRLVSTVHMLAGGLVFVATFGLIPAAYDLYDHLRTADSEGLATWAYLVFLTAVVQLGYAAYLWQMPDWSSVWVVTIVTLALSAGYAMVMGASYVSAADGWFVNMLDLSDKLRGGRAAGWCFIMLCLTCLLSYLSGRLSVRWYQASM